MVDNLRRLLLGINLSDKAIMGNLFTGALSERLDNKKLVFELNEGSLNLRIF